MDLPATPIAHLALTDSVTYRQFLLDPSTLTPSREGDASLKPTTRLKTLMEQSVDTPHGRMGALDAVLATMLEKALKGERWAIEKIYNELEHDGVHKVQSLNLHADFREDFNSILADIGIHDQYMTGTAVDITAETTPETPEKHTDERNDDLATHTAQDWENAFVEALRGSD